MKKQTVVFGLLGSTLDAGRGEKRWLRWRPTPSVCSEPEQFLVERYELLYQPEFESLCEVVKADIESLSPKTTVVATPIPFDDPWDFEEVYGALLDFARGYRFRDHEEYLLNITTGTHVAQICLFLLAESRRFPAKLLQLGPARGEGTSAMHSERRVIDLDLSRYDSIAERFHDERDESLSFLKSGIETKNRAFNELIEQIEFVAGNSREPILLMGPTGAGKSKLARRIFELKESRNLVEGSFVEVNCATLRGDTSMSTLFGHTKGAFTGAAQARPGLLLTAHRGVLFLDEIGELGLDEQTLLLRALEEKRFLPVGADREVESDFLLIAGTNRDLGSAVHNGRFREDLLARINLWSFRLPSLRERPEDIEPNLDFELERFARREGRKVSFNKEARAAYLRFATGAAWSANFRDLNASVTRMATFSGAGRITEAVVAAEVVRLRDRWREPIAASRLDPALADKFDRFDLLQLESVLGFCRNHTLLSSAARELFNHSREAKSTKNDADRLRKFLGRFGLSWEQVRGGG